MPTIIFKVKINDEIFYYTNVNTSSTQFKERGLFSKVTIKCVNFPGCESSMRIFPTETVDPDDEDFYTTRNWGISEGPKKTHKCLLPNFAEIVRLKKQKIRSARSSTLAEIKRNAEIRKARIMAAKERRSQLWVGNRFLSSMGF